MNPLRVSKPRGFTLAELTVYMALLGVLLSGTYATFALSMRYFTVARSATDLQSQAQQSVVHLVSELTDTTGASILYENQTTLAGIRFLSSRDRLGNFQQDTSGNILWQKWICYRWTRSTGNLTRMTSYLSTPTIVLPTCPYTPTTFPSTSSTIVGRNMTSLVFSGTNAVIIQARFEQWALNSGAAAADNRVDIVDRIKFRN